ncbi:hypothetical protein ED208_07300 [Stagnimonas aquatica]|uniref:Uncharacterized protein n=1 Tax=Stagnimonas aquatica TaxID=2689987 RepID=A0A3N0VDG3_9GAMM|nr:hypothetical protein ED208_07300 [Stagnimonas aquatica]
MAPRSAGPKGDNSERLFEAPIGRRVRERPLWAEHRRVVRKADRYAGACFLLLTFLCRSKEK